MEIPPSYESATTRDAWRVIAHYIPSTDLCSASLVCRRWYEIFEPFLWGAPASHFGTDNEAVYVALTRFRKTLKRARVSVRMLTHTLHIPPALPEIYGGPRPEWLRDVLDYLPCLQSLIVSMLPFFDHSSMMTLRAPPSGGWARVNRPYSLRLLVAEREPNTTSIGIAHALCLFPALIYLDLSYTTSAKDRMVLATITELHELQVLKLRGIGLKDEDVEFLANAIGKRVRFLDLRNNLLTDMAIRSLMQACFGPPELLLCRTSTERVARGDLSALSRSLLGNNADSLKQLDLDHRFVELLTRPLTGRSLLENLPRVGITHLFIAENQLTIEGVAGLLASARLFVLDAGTVDTARCLTRRPHTISPYGYRRSSATLPGAEKLIPILGTSAKESLTYLRIHHAVLTKDALAKDSSLPADLPELPGQPMRFETGATQPPAELDVTHEIYELPSVPKPMFELEDTAISHLATPSVAPQLELNHARAVYEDEPLLVRRGSVFAPEVVETNERIGDVSDVLSEDRPGLPLWQQLNSPSSPNGDPIYSEHVLESREGGSGSSLQARKIRELLAKRPRNVPYPPRRGAGAEMFPYLHPSHIPHLDTLVLTDVPSHVPVGSPILSSLIRFLVACSNEVLLACLQAKESYSLPPGRARIETEKRHARALFGLHRLVLEITPAKKSELRTLGPWKPHDYENALTKSATGDVDSERLWSAAIADFSFFGEEECEVPTNNTGEYSMDVLNEELSPTPEDVDCGLPELDTSLDLFQSGRPCRSRSNSYVTLTPHSGPPDSPSWLATKLTGESGDRAASQEELEVDLVSELAAFRRSKKAEYAELIRISRRQDHWGEAFSAFPSTPPVYGFSPHRLSTSPSEIDQAMPIHVEGHWKGEVKIVRNTTPKGRSGFVDPYGNSFEKGYLYP